MTNCIAETANTTAHNGESAASAEVGGITPTLTMSASECLATKTMIKSFREQWNDSCRVCGFASIKKNTAAQILAIIYIFGGEREVFTHNEKLLADIEYIQQEYGFYGGMIPDGYVVQRFQTYAKELFHCGQDYPEWAIKLMKENYNITI